MDHLEVHQFLGLLVVMLASAKLLGGLAQRIGQPAVLGELFAGVILGTSVAGLVNPTDHILHLLSELGVVILLFEIGLETDLSKLVRVGGAATVVAIVGVALPFALGYGACRLVGLENLESVVAGATLTATSVGITGRVLSDLNRLAEPESQIILGAAVIDDVIGLVILTIVAGLAQGQEVSALSVARITAVAFGFLAVTLLLGGLVVPRIFPWLTRTNLLGTPTILALLVVFGLAWLAHMSGSALIIGAFAAGLLLRRTSQVQEIERGAVYFGRFFVPLFFVTVGAAVDVRVFNPFEPGNMETLSIGGLLLAAAVIGKFAAGYAPYWFAGNKKVIGVGMIPRGEVGLIFAQMGLAGGVFDAGLFSAITLMVIVTTFMTPPLLKLLFGPAREEQRPPKIEGLEELVSEP